MPFYVMTNGEEFVVYRMQGFFDDVCELLCSVEDLPREWARIGKLLSFEAVKRYSSENEIKTQDLPAARYADYLRAAYSELCAELEFSMERTVSEDVGTGIRFNLRRHLQAGAAGTLRRVLDRPPYE